MSAIVIKNELYDTNKLDAIYQNIVARYKNNTPVYYAIIVDDFEVVQKTNDSERFYTYSDFVNSNSKIIAILLYKPNNSSDKLYFHLNANSLEAQKALNGVLSNLNPLDKEEEKERWRKDLHYEQLLEENENLKKEIEDLEQTIESIEEEKENIKKNRDFNYTSIAGILLDGALNSKIVKKHIPFLNNLSGINEEDQSKNENSFKRKNNTEQPNSNEDTEDAESEVIVEPQLNKEDLRLMEIMKEIKSRVGYLEFDNVIYLMDLITKNPTAIQFVTKQLNNYLVVQTINKNKKADSKNTEIHHTENNSDFDFDTEINT